MQKKLLYSYIIIIMVAVGISGIAFWMNGHSYMNRQTEEYYVMQAKMLGDFFEEENIITKEEAATFAKHYGETYGIRITIIAKDGQVYADSNASAEIENHATREEVVKALKGESSSTTRYSKTMKKDYAYSAVPIISEEFEGVLRVSLPLAQFKDFDKGIASSIWITVICCIIVAVILAFFFSNWIATPINEVTQAAEKISQGNYDAKIYTREKGQIGRLADAFNKMTLNLRVSIQKLTRRNVELEAMLSSMDSGVVAIDSADAILFYNDSFGLMSEGKNKNLTGKSLYTVMRNSIVFEVLDSVREQNLSVEKEGVFGTNQNKIIRVIGTPLTNENGKNLGVLIIIDDITKMKKLEHMRSDFVSNVTHELKTPLTSIRGFIDTLKNGAISDEAVARRFLDIIDIEAERLYSLIQDILLLSEIESKRDFEVVSTDITSSVKDVMELLEPKLPESVKMQLECAPYIRPFNCNPDRMKQLFINLLDNAIKYTESGTIKIKVEEVNDKLKLTIKDTGIGIETEHLSRIFERFYRVDKGRSRKQGGTGLGLSIVKHIVELYSGTIEVDSKLGEGTSFIIKFPYK